MKTKLSTLILLVFCTTGFFSCNDDDEEVKTTEVTLSIANPTDLEDLKVSKWAVTFTERNTNKTYALETESNTLSVTVPEGDYEIAGENFVTYTFMGNTVNGKLYFINKSNIVTGETVSIAASSFPKSEYEGEGGFVIEEIFYTGSGTPEGKSYLGDIYIKLYNNTDKPLYADGLFLATTQRNTSISYTYIPEILDKYVPVNGIIVIPGDGTKYPVQPGKSFILAASAVNHKEGNSNSFDLTIADMEWRNEHLANQPANNPNVPDAILLYNFFTTHHAGLSSVIMGRIEVSQTEFLGKYIYEYSWKMVFNGVEYERGPFLDYKIPNEWVMDAVYTSVEGETEAPVFAPSIDMGWTYCGSSFGDTERFGKSVRRKVESTTTDGREILQDTNNSAVDFIPNATPSLAK
ncbi:MAG: DUF4876 domain-containing protein [Tannerellaceae bacterium]|jgi:hypothetical protein|nr:DUF4876 domain-containing protein [Tannerellaceae bacterium]